MCVKLNGEMGMITTTSVSSARNMGIKPGDEIGIGSDAYQISRIGEEVWGKKTVEHGARVYSFTEVILELRLPGWKLLPQRGV